MDFAKHSSKHFSLLALPFLYRKLKCIYEFNFLLRIFNMKIYYQLIVKFMTRGS